jgi:NAD(P)-dependent dehydrogenase (short-subunit alcohol dehydrogenase family)
VIADRNTKDADAMVAEATSKGQKAFARELDVANEASVQALVDWTVATLGRIDAAVHSAGIGGPTLPLHEVTNKAWEQVIGINLSGTFYVQKALVSYWRATAPRLLRDDTADGLDPVSQRGSLVLIASVNASVASPMMGSYGWPSPLPSLALY